MEAIADIDKFFIFEDCDFCGQLMEPTSLEFRNMLEDHGIVRLDFCPCCGASTGHLKDNFIWRAQVTKWVINRRMDKKTSSIEVKAKRDRFKDQPKTLARPIK